MKYTCFLLLLLAFAPAGAKAQEIDNTAAFRNINAQSYVRAYSDDDNFTNTDEQYTEGLNIELCMPWVRRFPLSKLLVHPRFSDTRYGLAVEQAMYTPNDLSAKDIQKGDHPFAATLFLKTFLITTDAVHKQRFTTTLSTGMIGPWAQGDDLQHAAHLILNNVVPPGWKYQVANDAILNYGISYQKQIIQAGRIFSLDLDGVARGGTLSDEAGIGADLMLGYFESIFEGGSAPLKKIHFYVYYHPEVDIVGYDATLEGGVFNHSSTYVIAPNDLTRVTYQNRAGIVVDFNRFRLEYNECFLSPQFAGGPSHGYGGIGLSVILDRRPTVPAPSIQ